MQRIAQSELGNDAVNVLRRVMSGETFRVTVSGRDAAVLAPIDELACLTTGTRARDLIASARVDAELTGDLDQAFPDKTGDL